MYGNYRFTMVYRLHGHGDVGQPGMAKLQLGSSPASIASLGGDFFRGRRCGGAASVRRCRMVGDDG